MSKFKIESWKKFPILKLFIVKNTHSILKKDIDENSGIYPYVTASATNNSVSTYISYNIEKIEEGNSILIGGKTLVVSYQANDYFSNDSHNLALYLIDSTKRTKYIQLFLVTILRVSLSHLYSWGDSISKTSIEKDYIMLPTLNDGNPDWEFMEKYMESLEQNIAQSLDKLSLAKNSSQESINTTQWEDFHIYDIFDIDSGTKLDKAKMDTSVELINFVGRSNFNNGITQKVNIIKNLEPYTPGNLTLALGGEYLGSCFVQNYPFYTSQNVVVLIPKTEISLEAKQFIATTIFRESQNNYRAFIKELNRHIRRDFKFKLPVKSKGIPDYEYMTSYIKSLQNKILPIIEHLNFTTSN